MARSLPYLAIRVRWFLPARPTKLVRGAGVESYDDPPDEAPTAVPVAVEAPSAQPEDGSDLRRADDTERSALFDPRTAEDVAEESIDRLTGL
jgi:hypothetical protein